MEANSESEEISDSFICCVCLELLYKPIVLHCGHICCFWCVHRSMNGRHDSQCPVCRHPYNHFPFICQMLHFLLLKMYPIAYKMRERQILEEEKKIDSFSPQIDTSVCQSCNDGERESHRNHEHSFTTCLKFSSCSAFPSSSEEECLKDARQLDFHDNGQTVTRNNADGKLKKIEFVSAKEKKQVSVADLRCASCNQLLFRPVVLNCGHVYCEACISNPADELCRCQICECLHPRGLPKVCLELENFLGKYFSREYASRREVVQLKQFPSKSDTSACAIEAGKKVLSSFTVAADHLSVDPDAYVHFGVGCDYCGMYPITGKRYRCKDCVEKSGFDLCENCYCTPSKLPGRFNQRHMPNHKFELIKPLNFRDVMLRLVTTRSENIILDDGLENFVNDASDHGGSGAGTIILPADSQDDSSESSGAHFTYSDGGDNQNDTQFNS